MFARLWRGRFDPGDGFGGLGRTIDLGALARLGRRAEPRVNVGLKLLQLLDEAAICVLQLLDLAGHFTNAVFGLAHADREIARLGGVHAAPSRGGIVPIAGHRVDITTRRPLVVLSKRRLGRSGKERSETDGGERVGQLHLVSSGWQRRRCI